MKLVRDEPQQLLVLESPGLGVPRFVGWLVKLIAVGFAVAPLVILGPLFMGPQRPELPFIIFGAFFGLFWVVGAGSILRGVRKMLRFPRRIRVDRYAGELEIEDESLLDGKRADIVRLDRLRRVRVATTLAAPSFGESLSGHQAWAAAGRQALPRVPERGRRQREARAELHRRGHR
jgi:hypothetical protein